jgi:hypothetical protein
VSPDARHRRRLPLVDMTGGLAAFALWGVALQAFPWVPRTVLQATRLALLYAFARG